MASYFRDIWQGVSTVLIGMKITFGHLFKPTITIQYPHEILPMNERTRARLVNTSETCAVCYKCERVCPINIFTIKGVRADKDEDLGILPDGKPKKMHLLQFDIDFSKCVYCGLCTDVCDTRSLHWEAPQEVCTFTRDEMYLKFATIPEEQKIFLLKKEAEKKAARSKEKRPAGKRPVKSGAKAGIPEPGKIDNIKEDIIKEPDK